MEYPQQLRTILDTSVLINHWRRRKGKTLADKTAQEVLAWAAELIAVRKTDCIVTPVVIEMLAGTTESHELRLTRVFLSAFLVIDGGRLLPQDWKVALAIAERIPRNGKRRQLGDCLIRAIARRLRYSVSSTDQDFPP